MFQSNWEQAQGEALAYYIHQQTEKGSGIGKLGSLIHLKAEEAKKAEELQKMAS